MSQTDTSGIRFEAAQRLVEEMLARGDGAGDVDFDRLTSERPDLERELRDLRDACVDVDRVLGVARATEIARRAEADRLLAEISADPGPDGRYAVEREIGRGGMGAVFRVHDRKLDRALAMKVILGQAEERPGGGTPAVGPGPLSRFLNEARITSQLDHPGIVPVHEIGLDAQGRAYFTMKLVGGRTLSEVYRRRAENDGEWGTPKVLGLIQRACEAVAFAHERGVIHRDLKPSNVMVGDFGEVYVMDWGLARSVGNGASATAAEEESAADAALSTLVAETRDGRQAGTPAYMSPEQASGRIDDMGPQSDVYSIGAMLYELAAGHAPYCEPGSSSTPAEVLARVVKRPPAKLVGGDAPPELAAICERAMARSTSERYRDVGELSRDLQSFLDGRVVEAYETGAWAEARKWVRRNRALASALAAALLLLVAGLSASLVFKTRADAKAVEAADQARIATQRADDVLSLSAIQDLKNLEDRADALWPADPAMLPKYEAWLADARELIEGRPADPAKGLNRRPGLADHEAKLAELMLRAKPLSPEEAEADRRSRPEFTELAKERAKLQWMRRMLGDEPWPGEAEVEAALAGTELPEDAESLNRLAWTFVDPKPEMVKYGDERKGLLLGRRALAVHQGQEIGIRDTIAWGLFRLGRLDEALAEEQRGIEEAVTDDRKKELAIGARRLEDEIAKWRSPDARTARRKEADQLAAPIADLERAVAERRIYEFESREDAWWHEQLSRLVGDLKTFADEKRGGLYSAGSSVAHGWGIARRAAFARTIRERSVDGAEAAGRWAQATASIGRNPAYDGSKLRPQLGLLPIGEDPDSHLFEFAHLGTGEPATRGPDGKLVLTESTGLVFVLIPGGTFRMGAQSTDPNGANYDPNARESEGPVHEVEVSPFLLSKYEMTQGQWERFTLRNPSEQSPVRYTWRSNREAKPWSALLPVEQLNWTDCTRVLGRLGLALPTEAQWEYAARAGTSTPWWTGEDRATLAGAANLADAYGKTHGAELWSAWEPELDDGHTLPAEIGSFRANAFGLHDIVGNVAEWCLDISDGGFYRVSPKKDPVALAPGYPFRILRGGDFDRDATFLRSSARGGGSPDAHSSGTGVRPARALDP
jgi:formylglycine-generating enzyme required for sulfatase activity/serine/threonine protein kinase